jgi:uncharacterized membrane protein YoaK (UPF0700 family)
VIHLAATMFVVIVVSIAVGQIMNAFGHIILPILGFVAVLIIFYVALSSGKHPENALGYTEGIAIILIGGALLGGIQEIIEKRRSKRPRGSKSVSRLSS